MGGKAGKSGKKGNSKASEKKKERLEMEKLMNDRVKLVKAANNVEDPLENLPSFKKFEKGGMNVMISAERVTDLDQTTKDWLLDLITRNMKALYEESEWGWKTENKKEEMFDNRAWYLLARDMDNEGKLLGFSHFRFDMDYDDEVLYVYEIQLENSVRRKGLGKFMMQVLEIMAFKADMRKIMVTIFKHNPGAQKFFKDAPVRDGRDVSHRRCLRAIRLPNPFKVQQEEIGKGGSRENPLRKQCKDGK